MHDRKTEWDDTNEELFLLDVLMKTTNRRNVMSNMATVNEKDKQTLCQNVHKTASILSNSFLTKS